MELKSIIRYVFLGGVLLFCLPILIPILIPALIVGIVLFVKRPDLMLKAGSNIGMWWLGFTKRYRITGCYTYCYAERGEVNPDKPTLLLLHGFSASSNIWWPLAMRIPKEWHMICLDLPGHGNTTRNIQDSFTYEAQAEKVNQFVRVMGLNRRPLHVIGISMGGGVAGLFAANFPNALTKLTLLCPAGIKTDTLSDFDLDRTQNSISADLPDRVEEYEKVFPYFTHMFRHIKMPKQYWKGVAMVRRKDNPFFQTVLDDMRSIEGINELSESMANITVPTQVIWGMQDRLLHPSGADILRDGIKNVQVHMLERCGHIVIHERPYKSAKLILEYSES